MNFNTQIAEHKDVESAKISNLQEFSFIHNKRSYVCTERYEQDYKI